HGKCEFKEGTVILSRQFLIAGTQILLYVSAFLFFASNAYAQKPELITEEGHTSVVRCVAFSPNGRFVATGSEDKKIKLWDVQAGMEFRSLGGSGGTITSVLFLNDQTLVSSDGHIKFWNVITGEEIRTFEELFTSDEKSTPALALSEDRKTL